MPGRVWTADRAAGINPKLLNDLEIDLSNLGATALHGAKAFRDTFGLMDQAVVLSLIGNRSADPSTQVMGTTDPSATGERGSVTLYADNKLQAATASATTGTTFTATTVTATTWTGSIATVKAGMIIDAGTKSAVVISVSGNVVTHQGWRLASAVTTPPAANTAVKINQTNKIWAANFNVFHQNTDTTQAISGIEVGVITDTDDASSGLTVDALPYSWGIDVVAIASAGRPTIAYNARGRFQYGFASSGIYGGGAHFVAHKNFDYAGNTGAAFKDEDSGATVSFWAVKDLIGRAAFLTSLPADAQNRFAILIDGGMSWGDGGSSARDTTLIRDAVARLKLTGSLKSTGHSRWEGTGVLSGPSAAEVGWDSAYAYLVGYNRDTAAYVPARVGGSTVQLEASGTTRVKVDGTGLGFFNAAPVARPAHPVTLADVINALTSLGLTA